MRPLAHHTPNAAPPFEQAVLQGLSQRHKHIPSQWLYDERGQQLFEAAAQGPHQDWLRQEQALLQQCAAEVAELANERAGRSVIFVPHAAVSGFAPDELQAWLTRLHRTARHQALLVLGADATLAPDRLLPAYDDPMGLMARFNKNLLLRMQRELGATLDADAFRHAARLDTRQRRVELHLVSRCDQTVCVRGHHFTFLQGESILTALVHKTSALRLRSLAWQAGWQLRQFWADAQGQLALHVFESREALA